MLSCITACVEHEAVETAVHHDVYNIVNRLRQTGTLAAECEVCLRRQLRQQQKRLHHLQMLQLMLSWTHGSCGSRSSHSQANAFWAQCWQLGLLPDLHKHKASRQHSCMQRGVSLPMGRCQDTATGVQQMARTSS